MTDTQRDFSIQMTSFTSSKIFWNYESYFTNGIFLCLNNTTQQMNVNIARPGCMIRNIWTLQFWQVSIVQINKVKLSVLSTIKRVQTRMTTSMPQRQCGCLHHLLWPWPLTYDLQNLNRSSCRASGPSLWPWPLTSDLHNLAGPQLRLAVLPCGLDLDL